MKRFFITSACIIVVLTLIIITFLFGVNIYSRRNSIGQIDRTLFENARMNSSTVYYVKNRSDELEEVWRNNSEGMKTWYSFSEISEYLKDGFISSEDRSFYEHSGVNLRRTAFALVNTVLHLKPRFGASTITQQLIKNLSGDNEITIKRKLNEIIRSYNLENHYSKEEIFELYLNIVPMANNIYGVGAASEIYFSKSPSDLSLSEAALLVGIINSPGRYDPVKHPDEAIKKRNNVLFSMLDNGVISEKDYDNARIMPLDIKFKGVSSYTPMPWYVEEAYDEILDDLSDKYSISRTSASIILKGAKIQLNCDLRIQSILDDFFENENYFPPEVSNGLKYSMVVLENKSGNIVASVGGVGVKSADRIYDFSRIPIVPGSTLKPLALYAELVENGDANAATLFNDVPIYYKETENGLLGYPKNSPNVYSGLICLSDAIAFSKNTVAVEVYNRLGAQKVVNTLRRKYGFTSITESDYYESPLALGQLSKGVSLRELTRAYSAFPREGNISVNKYYNTVFDKNGDVLITHSPENQRILSVTCSRIMNQLLMEPVERGTARLVSLKYYVDTAGKTGTSGDDKDKVFIGYTPYYTIGIWCGYADGKTSIGSIYPSHLKIWNDIAISIHKSLDLLDNPIAFSTDGLLALKYSTESGKCVCEHCALIDESCRIGYFSPSLLPPGCECICDDEESIPAQKNTEA